MPAQASDGDDASVATDAEQQIPPIAQSTPTDIEQHTQPIALSIESAARAIDVSRTWLYEQIRLGGLASRKVAGRRLILRDDLINFVRDGGDDA